MRREGFPVAGDRGEESSALTGYWRRERGREEGREWSEGGNGVE